ncbi:hypothetical protein [Cupriavidus sp. 8B]
MEWRVAEGPPLVAVQREAPLDDLFIVGHDDPDEPTAFVAGQFVETIILEAGRPVLPSPAPAGSARSAGTSWSPGMAAENPPRRSLRRRKPVIAALAHDSA